MCMASDLYCCDSLSYSFHHSSYIRAGRVRQGGLACVSPGADVCLHGVDSTGMDTDQHLQHREEMRQHIMSEPRLTEHSWNVWKLLWILNTHIVYVHMQNVNFVCEYHTEDTHTKTCSRYNQQGYILLYCFFISIFVVCLTFYELWTIMFINAETCTWLLYTRVD